MSTTKVDYIFASVATKDWLTRCLVGGMLMGTQIEAKEVAFFLTDMEVLTMAKKMSDQGKIVVVCTTDQMKKELEKET